MYLQPVSSYITVTLLRCPLQCHNVYVKSNQIWVSGLMDGWTDRHYLPCVHLHIMQIICNNRFILLQEIGAFIQNICR
jgi:hypothetical protein